jgi:hypothetical protein
MLKKIRTMVRGSPGPSICALVVQYRLCDSGKEMLASSWLVRYRLVLQVCTFCTVARGSAGTVWYNVAYGYGQSIHVI